MNEQEAERIANEVASRYRACPRDELLRLLKEQDTFEVVAPSGTRHQLEVEAVWDDRKGKNLRVFVGIDDGGPSVFTPCSLISSSPRTAVCWRSLIAPRAHRGAAGGEASSHSR